MWKSEAEIRKTYSDHLDSLRLSGVEFSESAVIGAMEAEVESFRTGEVRDFTNLAEVSSD